MIIGSMVALVTPMQPDGSVDWAALEGLVRWHVEAGTQAIVAVGTTGESATLSVDEHCDVIRFVVEQVAGAIPVIAGTGANSTAEAIELTRSAKSVGADASLSVTPYYNKPTQKGLYEHYKTIAEATDFPIILYNVPGRTCCDMENETVVALASLPNIVGLKDATGEMGRIEYLAAHCPADFGLYSGDDATAMRYMAAGGHGSISVTANVAPEILATALQLALSGDMEGARALDAKLALLHTKLFVQANPIPVKYALMRMGKIASGIRLPLTPLEPQYIAEIETALQAADIAYE